MTFQFKFSKANEAVLTVTKFELEEARIEIQNAGYGCCQTNENSHRIACAALIYALNSWRHSVRAAVRLILKLSRE